MTKKGKYMFAVKSATVRERADETDEDVIVVTAKVSKENAKLIVAGKQRAAKPCELYQEAHLEGTQFVTFTMPVPVYGSPVELELARARGTADNEFISRVELPLRVACKYAIAMFCKKLQGG